MQLDADDDANPYYRAPAPTASDTGKGSSVNAPVTESTESAPSQEES